jgi:voltage-gated potassium channel
MMTTEVKEQLNPESQPPASLRSRVNAVLNHPSWRDRITRAVNLFLLLVIIVNTLAIILDTVRSIASAYSRVLDLIVFISILIFAVEYLLRIWSYSDAPTLWKRNVERFRYACSIFMIIDLVAIAALFIPIFFPRDFRLLRTVRILSVFKLGRYIAYVPSVKQIGRIFFRKREIISILLCILVVVILFSSTVMFLVENGAQPEKFTSIPEAMWWAAMTVTTVGYGDIYPITPLGKFLGSVITFTGLLALALPSAILASAFIEEQSKKNQLQSVQEINRDITRLERIAALRAAGLLTDEEVKLYKDRILAGEDTQFKADDDGQEFL